MFPILLKVNMFIQSALQSLPIVAAKGWTNEDTSGVGDDISNGFKSLAGLLEAAMGGIGIIFIVIGIVSIATAVKSGEQNPEAITGAVKNIIIGVLLSSIAGVAALFGFGK